MAWDTSSMPGRQTGLEGARSVSLPKAAVPGLLLCGRASALQPVLMFLSVQSSGLRADSSSGMRATPR